MPYLTTGLLSNASVEGVRQSATISVNISNDDNSAVAIQIEGFFLSGMTKVKYVEEFFTLTAGTVALKNFIVPFNAFEFVFFVSSQAVEVSVWRKDVKGNLNAAHLVVAEVSAVGMTDQNSLYVEGMINPSVTKNGQVQYNV